MTAEDPQAHSSQAEAHEGVPEERNPYASYTLAELEEKEKELDRLEALVEELLMAAEAEAEFFRARDESQRSEGEASETMMEPEEVF